MILQITNMLIVTSETLVIVINFESVIHFFPELFDEQKVQKNSIYLE